MNMNMNLHKSNLYSNLQLISPLPDISQTKSRHPSRGVGNQNNKNPKRRTIFNNFANSIENEEKYDYSSCYNFFPKSSRLSSHGILKAKGKPVLIPPKLFTINLVLNNNKDNKKDENPEEKESQLKSQTFLTKLNYKQQPTNFNLTSYSRNAICLKKTETPDTDITELLKRVLIEKRKITHECNDIQKLITTTRDTQEQINLLTKLNLRKVLTRSRPVEQSQSQDLFLDKIKKSNTYWFNKTFQHFK